MIYLFFGTIRPKSIFRAFFILLFFLLTVVSEVAAHPHVFITTRYTLVFDAKGLYGVRVSWSMDEMYSSMTGEDFDTDGDGTFNDRESGELVRLASESLPQFNFYTNIEIEGKVVDVKKVTDFEISYESGQLDYSFFVVCSVPSTDKPVNLKVAPYDPEMYCGLFFADDQPILLENSGGFNVETSIKEDVDKTIFFDTVHPTTLYVRFQKKS